MDSEGSSPCSEELATDPYPESHELNPHPQTLFSEEPFYYYLPIYT
jgi:hypothetical protein